MQPHTANLTPQPAPVAPFASQSGGGGCIARAMSEWDGDGVHGIIHQTADSQRVVPGMGIFYAVNDRLFE